MKLAMIGLGKMGLAMAERLVLHGHEVVAYDIAADVVEKAVAKKATGVSSLEDMIAELGDSPRVVWMMLPAGKPVEATSDKLLDLLGEGDIVVDGGNSNYHDTLKRVERFAAKGIDFVDVGVSGGVWGLKEGFNLMAGGSPEAFAVVEPALEALAPEGGYAHVGPVGAGHFVKMVHNGIEYGMMEAIAEGFELMEAKEEFDLDLVQLARLWENGSVIRSWLLELAADALTQRPGLEDLAPYVHDSGEGRWTVAESLDLAVPVPVITLALQMRFRSRQPDSFAARLLAALRNEFGGHAVREEMTVKREKGDVPHVK